MVSKPSKVKVEETTDDMGVLLKIYVEKEDRPYVIGKKGLTIKAIKRIWRVIGGMEKKRYNLMLVEEENE
jgi:predicted RNA-binding protein YlqC (UPF0109 family)